MEFIESLFYFIIVIGILVVIHEFGHFIAARMTGMRAEIFAVGMGARILGWNKITGFSFGKLPDDWEGGEHTDYRLCLFPIGGYVKVSGMIDESMDTDYASSEPQPWEFRSKNYWQKAFVLSAGVLMNIFLAVIIFASLVYLQGEHKLATTEIYKVNNNTVGSKIGFLPGDRVLYVADTEVFTWDEFYGALLTSNIGESRSITVLRNKKQTTLEADGKDLIDIMSGNKELGLTAGGISVYIAEMVSGQNAEKYGLQAGDTIKTVNGVDVNNATVLQTTLQNHKDKEVNLGIVRSGELITKNVKTNTGGQIGVRLGFAPIITVDYNIIDAVLYGFNESFRTLDLLIQTIRNIIVGKASFQQSIGGPIMIAKQASATADMGIASFSRFIAMLSMSLAFINILPFPALDGGHLIFVSLESAIRRELPLKIKMAIQQAGFVILILFMVYIFYIDIMR